MWQMNVRVIKVGSSTVDPCNMTFSVHRRLKNELGIGGGSTVVLIREKRELLLVDPGYERESDFTEENNKTNWDLLRMLLQLNGINHTDITKVFITHLHRDHFGCIEHFKHAAWYCNEMEIDESNGYHKDRLIPVSNGTQIIPNVVVMLTPGHTQGHTSLIWSDENKSIRVAISGDAIINLAWLQSGHIWKFNSNFFDIDSAKRSIRKLLSESDVVIPGHGQPFFVTKRLKDLIREAIIKKYGKNDLLT